MVTIVGAIDRAEGRLEASGCGEERVAFEELAEAARFAFGESLGGLQELVPRAVGSGFQLSRRPLRRVPFGRRRAYWRWRSRRTEPARYWRRGRGGSDRRRSGRRATGCGSLGDRPPGGSIETTSTVPPMPAIRVSRCSRLRDALNAETRAPRARFRPSASARVSFRGVPGLDEEQASRVTPPSHLHFARRSTQALQWAEQRSLANPTVHDVTCSRTDHAHRCVLLLAHSVIILKSRSTRSRHEASGKPPVRNASRPTGGTRLRDVSGLPAVRSLGTASRGFPRPLSARPVRRP